MTNLYIVTLQFAISSYIILIYPFFSNLEWFFYNFYLAFIVIILESSIISYVNELYIFLSYFRKKDKIESAALPVPKNKN